MSTRSANWVVLRVFALLALALPICHLVAHIHADYLRASAWLVPSVAGTAMAMTCFVLQFWRMIPGSSVRWRYPSWFENPLALRQPLQWGLLIGEALMLSGAGCAFVDALAFPQQCNWEIPMAVGAGVWLGTYLFGELWVANARR